MPVLIDMYEQESTFSVLSISPVSNSNEETHGEGEEEKKSVKFKNNHAKKQILTYHRMKLEQKNVRFHLKQLNMDHLFDQVIDNNYRSIHLNHH